MTNLETKYLWHCLNCFALFIRFWIAWLFLGPTLRSLTAEWYMFLTVGTLAAFTSLTCTHVTLLMSQTHVSTQAEGLLVQLIFEHALRARDKGGDDSKSSKDHRSSKSNFSGRLNNLCTSDVSNIKNGRDFAKVGKHCFRYLLSLVIHYL